MSLSLTLNFRSAFSILIFFISTAHAADLSKPPQLPSADQFYSDASSGDPETAEAFFMLSLYEHGKAGGNTGVCVDFTTVNGQPKVEIGLSNDAAFDSGQARPKNPEVVTKELQSIFSALANTQGTGAMPGVSIMGYTDGQYFSAGNKSLAEKRGEAVKSILVSSNLASDKTAVYPIDSTLLEQRPKNQQACEARRRVVISLDAKTTKATADENGDYKFFPSAFEKPQYEATTNFVNNTLGAYMPDTMLSDLDKKAAARNKQLYKLQAKNPDATLPDVYLEKAKEIYANLKDKDHKISSKCDQFPLKDLTIAYINRELHKNVEDITSGFDIASLLNVKTDANHHAYLEDPNSPPGQSPRRLYIEDRFRQPGSGSDPSGIELGKPSSIFACFDPSGDKAWQSAMQTAPDFCVNGSAKVANNPSAADANTLVEFDTAGAHAYKCLKCGKGFEIEKTPQGYQASFDDRLFKSGTSTEAFTQSLNHLSDADPFSVGADMKPRVFVVQNCSCATQGNIFDRIKSGVGVQKIDPLEQGSAAKFSSSMTKSQLANSCVISPRVMHTCAVDPEAVKGATKDVSKLFLKYLDPLAPNIKKENLVNGALIPFQNLDDLVKGFATNAAAAGECPGSKIISAQEKVNSVSCSGSVKTALPSDDANADCPLTAK
jgi:hypothetical protein